MAAEKKHNDEKSLDAFSSPVLDRIFSGDDPGVWNLPGGELVLPRVFGFCRGVKRALIMADKAVTAHTDGHKNGNLVLLGEIIHNPWVNDYFSRRGVKILTTDQCSSCVGRYVTREDTAIIPAFGVPLEIEQQLKQIGCDIIDCSCGDVIRLWRWSEKAVKDGFGVLIFGRAMHDETVVTKTRLAAAGGKYLVVENIEQVEKFTKMIADAHEAPDLREIFGPDATNTDSPSHFLTLAQVSQTTMLYNHTQKICEMILDVFVERFGKSAAKKQLMFQPTVCRATQDRQNAAVELCSSGCDLVIVVGGFGSSNTRHLHELAGKYAPSYLIEDAEAIQSPAQLTTYDGDSDDSVSIKDWLPAKRPLKIGVLAGASSPQVVVGQVLEKLAGFLK
ncbi:MAG: 4-hydroxy-3-methylbut-2-enyl diphosphate reductase [Phycisphaerae bacterium]|nr:4-hydroxy-3-methylbut-2-enyl diphosphate reductase [Phycisphaerae bacterium]